MNVHVTKPVPINFKMVADAYQRIRNGGKGVGVDKESWEKFDEKLQDNLYVIWNRLASGTYHPAAVREVEIAKKDGKMRKLGIPTLRDRIAQSVVKDYMEKRIDHHFHQHSYGYRPMKSGHQAIEEVRKNCKHHDWVIDLDISKFFDQIDHELMIKAVEWFIEDKWVKMYVTRWLNMKIVGIDGVERDRQGKGTPQGGVISPLLANIFLHFAIDKWLEKNHSGTNFVRYADDMVIHCDTQQQAEQLFVQIKERLQQLGLDVNEEKTKIVYCKDYRRKAKHNKVEFGFLGFSYRPRKSRSNRDGKNYTAFTAEISKDNQRKITEAIREGVPWRNTRMEITDIALLLNSKVRGWINYFGLYGKRALRNTLMNIDRRVVKWLQSKYKFSGIRKAIMKLSMIMCEHPRLFYHWQKGYCYVIKK